MSSLSDILLSAQASFLSVLAKQKQQRQQQEQEEREREERTRQWKARKRRRKSSPSSAGPTDRCADENRAVSPQTEPRNSSAPQHSECASVICGDRQHQLRPQEHTEHSKQHEKGSSSSGALAHRFFRSQTQSAWTCVCASRSFEVNSLCCLSVSSISLRLPPSSTRSSQMQMVVHKSALACKQTQQVAPSWCWGMGSKPQPTVLRKWRATHSSCGSRAAHRHLCTVSSTASLRRCRST